MRITLPLSLLLSSLLSLPFTTANPVNTTLISSDIEKREASTLTVTTHLKHNCKGTAYEKPYVHYSEKYPAATGSLYDAEPLEGKSYYLSRALDPSEELVFSVISTIEEVGVNNYLSNPCGNYVGSAPTGKPGCHNVKAACFQLKHH